MLLKNSLHFAPNHRARAIIWLLLISLLIHLIIADLFFEYGFQRRVVNFVQEIAKTMEPAAQKIHTQEKKQRRDALIEAFKAFTPEEKKGNKRKAKLVARRGNFGWTLFDSPAAPKKSHPGKQEIPTTTEGDIAVAQTAYATEDASQVQLTHNAPAHSTESLTPEAEQDNTTTLSSPIQENLAQNLYSTAQEAPACTEEISATQQSDQTSQKRSDSTEQKKPHEIDHTPAIPTQYMPIDVAENTQKLRRFPELNSSLISAREKQDTISMPKKNNIDIAERLINKGESEVTQIITTAQRIEQIDRMREILASGSMRSLARRKPHVTKSIATKSTGPRRSLVRGSRREEADDGKPRNIIALTKGFIEKWEGEDGNDLIDRDGDPNIQPDLEDIKLISYESKLFWCLQGAWNQNFKYRQDLRFPEGVAYIDYTIDRTGKLVDCQIIQSTGHQGLDRAILKTFTIAAPFPPFPTSFNTETYRSGQCISVHHQRYGF